MRGTLALLCVEFDNDVFHIHVLRNVTGKKVLEELAEKSCKNAPINSFLFIQLSIPHNKLFCKHPKMSHHQATNRAQ